MVRYWKPIQTGMERDDDTAAVRWLGECREEEIFGRGIRLEKPVSPHLAAEWAGTHIELSSLHDLLPGEGTPQRDSARWIVEGAGGVRVPVNEVHFMSDFMAMLNLPVLVVARSGLGTINHTLLTLEALRLRHIRVAGVVMVGAPDRDNRAAIERFGSVRVVGELPPLRPLAPETLHAWSAEHLDTDGALQEYFS